MGMSLVDETFEVYVLMRKGGKEAKAALDALRSRIETMQAGDRTELVRRVKTWEAQHLVSPDLSTRAPKPVTPPNPSSTQIVTPLPPPPPASPPPSEQIPDPQPLGKPAANEKTIICSRCGKANNGTEVFCQFCGNFLSVDSTQHATMQLSDPDQPAKGADFFGPETTLVLVVTANNQSYSVQPQRYKHETVIGRSEGSTMKPDIDLSAHNASDFGVSRLHVALQYNAKNNLLSVSDMKSANGTFINGQKLYPQEVRVLRDGDELRLGRLVLRAYFKHPGTSGGE
jgi:hypothetical protein